MTQHSLGFEAADRDTRTARRARRLWKHRVARAAAAIVLDTTQAEFSILWNLADAHEFVGPCAALAPRHSDRRARQAFRRLEALDLVSRELTTAAGGRGRVSILRIDPAGVAKWADVTDNRNALAILLDRKPSSGHRPTAIPTEQATAPPTEIPTEAPPLLYSTENKEYMVQGPRKTGRADQTKPRSEEPVRRPTIVAVDQATPIAASLFERLGYTGSEGQTLWKAAAAQIAGTIPEAAVSSAAAACQAKRPRNPPADFRVALADVLEMTRGELSAEFASVRLAPFLPAAPPKHAPRRQPRAQTQTPPPAPRHDEATLQQRQAATIHELARIANAERSPRYD